MAALCAVTLVWRAMRREPPSPSITAASGETLGAGPVGAEKMLLAGGMEWAGGGAGNDQCGTPGR